MAAELYTGRALERTRLLRLLRLGMTKSWIALRHL
jgi:hypothetical protein